MPLNTEPPYTLGSDHVTMVISTVIAASITAIFPAILAFRGILE